MKLPPKTIVLKNGHIATLQSPCLDDAEELLHMIIQSCGETENLARYPEEWNMTIAQEEAWIQRINDSPSTLSILCHVDEKIVGSCEIRFNTGIKTAHRATVAIAILQKYWGLGIGSAMFSELIEAAKKHGTKIIELEYMEGNNRGLHLYKKFGFQAVSTRPNAYKLKDGSFRDEIYMQKYL